MAGGRGGPSDYLGRVEVTAMQAMAMTGKARGSLRLTVHDFVLFITVELEANPFYDIRVVNNDIKQLRFRDYEDPDGQRELAKW